MTPALLRECRELLANAEFEEAPLGSYTKRDEMLKHIDAALSASAPDYEALEKEHFGDSEKKTGIYAAPSTDAQTPDMRELLTRLDDAIRLAKLKSDAIAGDGGEIRKNYHLLLDLQSAISADIEYEPCFECHLGNGFHEEWCSKRVASDTPETDAICNAHTADDKTWFISACNALSALARNLERQRDAARAEQNRICELHKGLMKAADERVESAERQLAAASDSLPELPPRWTHHNSCGNDTVVVPASDYDAIRSHAIAKGAECDRLREDAERYRWLQANANLSLGGIQGNAIIELDRWALQYTKANELDQAIDAARGKP